jgi:hypothetical protein
MREIYFALVELIISLLSWLASKILAKGHPVLYCLVFCGAEGFHQFVVGCLSLNPSKKLCAFLSIHQKAVAHKKDAQKMTKMNG